MSSQWITKSLVKKADSKDETIGYYDIVIMVLDEIIQTSEKQIQRLNTPKFKPDHKKPWNNPLKWYDGCCYHSFSSKLTAMEWWTSQINDKKERKETIKKMQQK